MLDKGEIVQAGTHEELLADENGMYREIYEIQTKIDAELEKEISLAL